jgi:hypothetical protein
LNSETWMTLKLFSLETRTILYWERLSIRLLLKFSYVCYLLYFGLVCCIHGWQVTIVLRVSDIVFHGVLSYLGCWLFARKHSSDCSEDSEYKGRLFSATDDFWLDHLKFMQCRGFLMYFLMTWNFFHPHPCF